MADVLVVVAAGPADRDAAESWRKELLRLTEERDRAEHSLRKKLAEAGAFVGEIEAKTLAARLAPGTAVAAFLRYTRFFDEDPATGETPPKVDSMHPFVPSKRMSR